ncbi:hypothetical protein SAMN05443572_112223 [Myxococcus fulvus]|uniref:Uncharacterized protein n=1 Tax=Myxococcus fulvus TaxID=33 RepID=A0ABY1CTS8_MYXFU|nr:hypothetical protein SAMN05443572_112223 [Myxococcus fulvus]
MFQPTLLAVTRSDRSRTLCRPSGALFQPTLLAVTRSDERVQTPEGIVWFQPTLLAVTRSDRAVAYVERKWRFQPTLLAVTRSDSAARGAVLGPRVSTHAPHGHEERLWLEEEGGTSGKFQPSLLAVTRSDAKNPATHEERDHVSTHAPRGHEERPGIFARATSLSEGFNPRSSRSRGATREGAVSQSSSSEFQPTLLAVTRSEPGSYVYCMIALFQPTLLAVTRSDAKRPGDESGAVVSTHAPRGHEEQLCVPAARALGVVSTHAPRGHEERLVLFIAAGLHTWFQPTLLAVTRSDVELVALGAALGVSTHAPRGHEERLLVGLLVIMGMRFQPTLLAVTRSDATRRLVHVAPTVSTHAPRGHEERPPGRALIRSHRCFNPRSSRSRGATPMAFAYIDDTCFNPRSSRSRGATVLLSHHNLVAVFQPTLLAVTRSDCERKRPVARMTRFQPTLLAVTRSDRACWATPGA